MRKNNNDGVLLYSSTNKVYGALDNLKTGIINNRHQLLDIPNGVSEEQNLDFHSPYGCSKGSADQYVRDYSRIFNLKTIVFRQSCIYGYNQFGVEDQGWVAWFTIASLFDKKLTIYGDGKQVRDILFIDDLINAYDLAIHNEKTYGQVYNIGGGSSNQMSLLELISLLEKFFRKKLLLKYSKERPGDQPVYVSDITKANNEFNWYPKIDVNEGVEKLSTWIKENKKLFSDYI
jgi:CDP-paratose 2-epimerase